MLAAGAMLMTMGCATVPPAAAAEEEVPVRGETGRRCDASKAQGLVGRAASQELGAEALRLTGAGTLRWIPEGGVVTMDHREDRVNVELDRQNRVTKVRCG
jgi:hypothetical protein